MLTKKTDSAAGKMAGKFQNILILFIQYTLSTQTERLLDLFILCTRSSHRGQGLAGQLVKTALESASEEGVRGVVSLALSNYTQKIFRRLGLTELNPIDYADYNQVIY